MELKNESILSGEKQNFSVLAAAKIAQELKNFSGNTKEKAVSEFVASTLTHFCEQSERFAQVVYKTVRTLSNCCAEIMVGCGSHISDIDVYRKAVQSYFPNSDISFKMEIQFTGEAPSDTEITRQSRQQTSQNNSRENKPTFTSNQPKKYTENIQISLFD